MDFELTYKPFGEQAVLIEWEQNISLEILKDIQQFEHSIKNDIGDYVTACVPAYASLTVLYQNINYAELVSKLKVSYQNKTNGVYSITNNYWQLPVCYHPGLGFDLVDFAATLNLSPNEVINIHTSTIYTVYFLGFLPGFLYLGGLDKRLHFPRKAVPMLQIPRGSVGIGGQQTGVYPQSSPAGWHIIGNCPFRLFNAQQNPPSPFKAGDQIQFVPISLKDFESENFSLKEMNE